MSVDRRGLPRPLLRNGCGEAAEPAARPNILFAIADDASFPHMGAYGCYFVGQTGKGWVPGMIENDAHRQLIGRDFNERQTAPPTQDMSTIDYAANFADYRTTPLSSRL